MDTETMPQRHLKLRILSTVPERSVEFLFHPYMPKGKIALSEGWQGVGKSYLLMDLTARVSQGVDLEGEVRRPRDVIYFSAEDDPEDTIRPRVAQLGDDLERVYVQHMDLDSTTGILQLDEAGVRELDEEVAERDVALIVLDPLFAFVGSGVDTSRSNQVRAILTRLFVLAQKHRLAVIGVWHFRKSGGRKEVAGSGVLDWAAHVRSVLTIGYDPDDESKRAMLHTKHNLTAPGDPLGFVIDGDGFRWTGSTNLTYDKMMGNAAQTGRPQPRSRRHRISSAAS